MTTKGDRQGQSRAFRLRAVAVAAAAAATATAAASAAASATAATTPTTTGIVLRQPLSGIAKQQGSARLTQPTCACHDAVRHDDRSRRSARAANDPVQAEADQAAATDLEAGQGVQGSAGLTG